MNCLDKKFLPAQSKTVKLSGKNGGLVLWIEAIGFLVIIGLSWLSEAVRFPHFAFGESSAPNWERAILRTVVILVVWSAVHFATWRLLKRLRYLEGFLRICSWCRKVGHRGEWLTMEDYFNTRFATRATHGMCPECLQKKREELKQKGTPASLPN